MNIDTNTIYPIAAGELLDGMVLCLAHDVAAEIATVRVTSNYTYITFVKPQHLNASISTHTGIVVPNVVMLNRYHEN